MESGSGPDDDSDEPVPFPPEHSHSHSHSHSIPDRKEWEWECECEWEWESEIIGGCGKILKRLLRQRFRASQPKDRDRPKGAYFTTIQPTTENLRMLHQRVRVPVKKQRYVFLFVGDLGLMQLNEGRGRDRYIFFSAADYLVERSRQRHGDLTARLTERLT